MADVVVADADHQDARVGIGAARAVGAVERGVTCDTHRLAVDLVDDLAVGCEGRHDERTALEGLLDLLGRVLERSTARHHHDHDGRDDSRDETTALARTRIHLLVSPSLWGAHENGVQVRYLYYSIFI